MKKVYQICVSFQQLVDKTATTLNEKVAENGNLAKTN